MKKECWNCKPIVDSFEQSFGPEEAQDKILRFITKYRESHIMEQPCFSNFCMPLIQILEKSSNQESSID